MKASPKGEAHIFQISSNKMIKEIILVAILVVLFLFLGAVAENKFEILSYISEITLDK